MHQITAEDIKLVYTLTKRYKDEDMEQEGMLGLLSAARLYDPSRGVPFGPYANRWIRRALQMARERKAHIVGEPSETGIIENTLREPEDFNDTDIKKLLSPLELKVVTLKRCGYIYTEIAAICNLSKKEVREIWYSSLARLTDNA